MGEYLQRTNVGTGRIVVQYQAGAGWGCVILDVYEVKCFGYGIDGQLGYGDSDHRGDQANEMGDYLPYVQIATNINPISLHTGLSHVCVILNDNSMKCWGENGSGRLGLGHLNNIGNGANEMWEYLPFTNLGSSVEVELCFSLNPSFSPTLSPSLDPSFFPTITFNPTITYSPTSFTGPSCIPSEFSGLNSICVLTTNKEIKCW